jgi:Na+/H+ antiporter NhaD/arsenite permease-like protein
LSQLSQFLQKKLPNNQVMIVTIGILSAFADNGSLVAATQGMFSITDFLFDNALWEFIALCAGTGGSMLIIGSAAGVAVMEKEKMSFL